MENVFGLMGWTLLCLGVSALGAPLSRGDALRWYVTLRQPWFGPPEWLLGPMGTSLHAAAAVGAWWVWLAEGGRLSSPALMCFCVMLLLSGLWPMFLLRLRSPKWGWRAIALAWLAAWATLGLFWLTEPISGWWVLPILLWLSYCLWVTHALQRMNRA